METAGLVIGSLSLASLFETCMKCFDYIDTGKQYGEDYQRFAMSLRSIELHMSRWWHVSGLHAGTARMSEDAISHIEDLLALEDAAGLAQAFSIDRVSVKHETAIISSEQPPPSQIGRDAVMAKRRLNGA